MGQNLAAASQAIDLSGKVVAPGFLDMHVHLREPGFEYKETIASGMAAAAAGVSPRSAVCRIRILRSTTNR